MRFDASQPGYARKVVKEPRQPQPEPQVLEGEDGFPRQPAPSTADAYTPRPAPELGTRRGWMALSWGLLLVLAVCALVIWIAVR